MGIMEVIKKGFGETSKLLNVVRVFFVFNVVIGLLSLPLTDPANAGNPATVTLSVVSSVLFFLVFIFLQGGAMGTVKDQIKTASSSLAQFTSYGKSFYLRILGLLLVYLLIAVGIVLVLSLISAGILLLGDNVATRSIVAVIVTVVAVAVITLLVYPIYSIVVDDCGPIAALKNGVTVAKNNFFKTLGEEPSAICLMTRRLPLTSFPSTGLKTEPKGSFPKIPITMVFSDSEKADSGQSVKSKKLYKKAAIIS